MNYQVDFLNKRNRNPKTKIAGVYYYTPCPPSKVETMEVHEYLLLARVIGVEKELISYVEEYNINEPTELIHKVFKKCFNEIKIAHELKIK